MKELAIIMAIISLILSFTDKEHCTGGKCSYEISIREMYPEAYYANQLFTGEIKTVKILKQKDYAEKLFSKIIKMCKTEKQLAMR